MYGRVLSCLSFSDLVGTLWCTYRICGHWTHRVRTRHSFIIDYRTNVWYSFSNALDVGIHIFKKYFTYRELLSFRSNSYLPLCRPHATIIFSSLYRSCCTHCHGVDLTSCPGRSTYYQCLVWNVDGLEHVSASGTNAWRLISEMVLACA